MKEFGVIDRGRLLCYKRECGMLEAFFMRACIN